MGVLEFMSNHFGYWVFGKDMLSVDLSDCKSNGVTDIFLNYYAFNVHGESKVLKWIGTAKDKGINVHIWMQCFYNDGGWVNPVTDKSIVNLKLKEAKKYANIKGVYGLHLDYLRFPGNAYKTKNGAVTITNFVESVRKECKDVFLSCAVMPEMDDDKYYYGQDIDKLGKIVDAVLPMQYKGNYGVGNEWLSSTSKYFSGRSNLWSGLQTYKSDDDTSLLSTSELENDIQTCLKQGAKGVILFRYGLVKNINFKKFIEKEKKDTSNKVSVNEIKLIATGLKKYIETNKKVPTKLTVNNHTYTYGQIVYILSYHVNHLNKSCSLFKVANAKSIKGNKIQEKLVKDDYLDVSKRASLYINKNRVCPNYVLTKKSHKRLKPQWVIYMLARVIVYYYKHNKLPSSALVDYTFFKK